MFPGGKGGRCVYLTSLPPSCAVVMKSGNLNFLEPSGHLQACDGTDLPLSIGYIRGHAVVQLVEAPRYKSEGRGSIPDVVTGVFH